MRHISAVSCVLIFTALTKSIGSENVNNLLRSGMACNYHWQCYSGVCYTTFKADDGFCAPDGPVNGTMAAGSFCTSNSQCFSGYCYQQLCAPDSRIQGKVGAGGMCWYNEQCYSGLCRHRQCLAEAVDVDRRDANVSLLPAGTECQIHEQCYSGHCHSFRCAPDAKFRNLIPSGGTCSSNEQCTSNICYAERCSPESYLPKAKGKVANGGRCHENKDCPPQSGCEDDICVIVLRIRHEYGGDDDEEDDKDDDYYDTDDDDDDNGGQVKAAKPGSKCKVDKDCETAPCVFGRCAPSSPANASLIADGGRCLTDAQCASGQCHAEICSVSYAPRVVTGWVAAGSYCRDNRHCFSYFCVESKCSPDSYADDPQSRRSDTMDLYANRVAAGGTCNSDSHCYSDLCSPNKICASDGPQVRSVASGGWCVTNLDCASGYCYQNRCITADETLGRVAPGGRCPTSDYCAPGSMCVNDFCIRPKDGAIRPLIPLRSVARNGACWMGAQCTIGKCLQRRCRAPAYVAGGQLGAHGCMKILLMIVAFFVAKVL